jgi:cytochrome b561
MKQLLLQCLRLFLKISNHAALLLPHVKQTDDQRKRVGALLLYQGWILPPLSSSLLYMTDPGYKRLRWI